MAKSSFGKSFAKARKEQGAGGTFVWLKSEGGDGKSYSTNIAGETGKKSSKGFSVEMASKAIDKAGAQAAGFTSVPKPPPSNRPKTVDQPTSKGIRMPKAGDITVSKLPKDAAAGTPKAKAKPFILGRFGNQAGMAKKKK